MISTLKESLRREVPTWTLEMRAKKRLRKTGTQTSWPRSWKRNTEKKRLGRPQKSFANISWMLSRTESTVGFGSVQTVRIVNTGTHFLQDSFLKRIVRSKKKRHRK